MQASLSGIVQNYNNSLHWTSTALSEALRENTHSNPSQGMGILQDAKISWLSHQVHVTLGDVSSHLSPRLYPNGCWTDTLTR